MKLREALRILGQPTPADDAPLTVFLVCGYNSLHLATFLTAELRMAMPARAVRLSTGLFGDLHGSLADASRSGCSAIALSIEWQDLDPRLGLRRLGGWSSDSHGDILASVATSLEQLAAGIQIAANRAPVAVSLPTLPLPPLAYTPARTKRRDRPGTEGPRRSLRVGAS